MTRTSEPTTVTSEAVLGVAPTLSADRSYHGTARSQWHRADPALGAGQPGATMLTRTPCALLADGVRASASWVTRPSLGIRTPWRSEWRSP